MPMTGVVLRFSPETLTGSSQISYFVFGLIIRRLRQSGSRQNRARRLAH